MADRSSRVIKKLAACWREYEKEQSNPSRFPYLAIRVANPDNLSVWYYLVYGLDTPFKGGQYIFEAKPVITAKGSDTRVYPDIAPHIIPLTPTGLYTVGQSFCISNGEFHKEQTTKLNQGAYAITNNMYGFGRNIVSPFLGMNDLGYGISLIHNQYSDNDRARFARESIEYNLKHNAAIMKLFEGGIEFRELIPDKANTEDKPMQKEQIPESNTKNKMSKLKAAAAAKKGLA